MDDSPKEPAQPDTQTSGGQRPVWMQSDGHPPASPTRIGKYHIKRVIASGGMGVVYEAMQDHPRRVVALKVMKRGIASRSALRRFEYESQLLARLRHPGIAQVYDAGTHADDSGTVPYFVMEYIPNAKPITQYADEKKLGTRQRLELFSKVCDAVHHGHQKGIIHRDLKPGNILVDSHGQVKIIDFGVARSTDSDLAVTTLQTDVGQLIGTLQYMSPEQCEADPHDIDVRSDVYSLGIVLYQLLCGKLPYDVATMAIHQATRIIREQHPTRLSTVDRALRGDVETIALKALEKDRDRRYQSAVELFQDIRRYLDGEAIVARRASLYYQLSVFARRNKALFGAVSAIFVILVGALIVTTLLYRTAESARQQAIHQSTLARAAEDDARQKQHEAEVNLARALEAEKNAAKETEVARREARKASQVSDFLKDMLGSVHPAQAKGREVTVREIVDRASERVGTEVIDDPNVEGFVRGTLAWVYGNLGMWEQAIPHRERIVEIQRALHGDDDPGTIEAELYLSGDVYQSGRTQDALQRQLPLLERARNVLAPDDAVLLNLMSDTGNTLRAVGRAAEAEPLLTDALSRARAKFGDEHDLTATIKGNLASVYMRTNRYAEGAQLFLEQIAFREKANSPEDPWVIRSKSELANLYIAMGEWDKAERFSRDAAQTARRVLGMAHVDTRDALARHINSLEPLERYHEAEQEALELLDVYSGLSGVDSTDARQCLVRLASLATQQDALDRAAQYVERLKESCHRRAESPDVTALELNDCAWQMLTLRPPQLRSPSAALPLARRAVELTNRADPSFLDTLALALAQSGDLQAAVDLQRTAIILLPNRDSFPRPAMEMRLIDWLEQLGRPDAVEDHLRLTYERRRDELGEDHDDTVMALSNLSVILIRHGKSADAIEIQRKVLESLRRKYSDEHPKVALALGNLGAALLTDGHPDQAEPLLRQSVDMYVRVSGPITFSAGNVRSHLGACLTDLRRFQEAERELLEAQSVLEQRAAPGHERIIRNLRRLVQLYEAWNRVAPAAAKENELQKWQERLSTESELAERKPE